MTKILVTIPALEHIDADPHYGPIGAPFRRHGRCTCRNNPSWPGCSLCQDMLRCNGCKYCDPYYVNDCADETAKGKPWCGDSGCRGCAGHEWCGRPFSWENVKDRHT